MHSCCSGIGVLLPALVETTGQRAYFSVEKSCWRLFNLASLNISGKVKFAKFAKYKGTLNVRDLQYFDQIYYCQKVQTEGAYIYKLGGSFFYSHGLMVI